MYTIKKNYPHIISNHDGKKFENREELIEYLFDNNMIDSDKIPEDAEVVNENGIGYTDFDKVDLNDIISGDYIIYEE